ncbi:MAG: hypothetical protein ABFE07_02125, partial [Armatimonadia bacterium]
AHWANVYNAENFRKIATALQSQADALAEARRENERLSEWFGDKSVELATAEASLATMREALEAIEQYPAKGNSRRDGDGYPKEVVYDKYAYRRLVDSYRIAARRALGGGNAE